MQGYSKTTQGYFVFQSGPQSYHTRKGLWISVVYIWSALIIKIFARSRLVYKNFSTFRMFYVFYFIFFSQEKRYCKLV